MSDNQNLWNKIYVYKHIYKDLKALEKSVGDNNEDSSNLDLFSLEMLSIGLVNKMIIESRNDEYPYVILAIQEDFDRW